VTGGKRSGRGRDGGGTCANVQSVCIYIRYYYYVYLYIIRVSSARARALQDVHHIAGIVFYFAGRLQALAFRRAIFRFSARFRGVGSCGKSSYCLTQ